MIAGLAEACAAVAGYLGEPFEARELPEELPPLRAARRMLAGAQLRSRQVLLRDDWWRHATVPLLGFDESGTPIALIPSKDGYALHDGRAAAPVRIDAARAQTLAPEALSVYRRLPDRPLTGLDVLAFTRLGSFGDVVRLLAAAALSAFLAVLTPLATQLLVAQLIPAGDRSGLVLLVTGLAFVAAAIGALQIVTATAVLRFESRTDLHLQAALIDRLLRAPTRLFKLFAVGDLSQRALGAHAIRQALSSSAISAILAVVFGVVSVVLMFVYSPVLAAIGLVCALAVAACIVGCSFLQLRYERTRTAAEGLSAATTFQLVRGIVKIRATGAAERMTEVWRKRYSAQMAAFVGAQSWSNTARVVAALLPSLATVFVLAPGYAAHALAPAQFLGFASAFGQVLASVAALGSAVASSIEVVPLYERLRPVLAEAPEVRARSVDPGMLSGAIAFENLSFRYVLDGPPILSDLNFAIAPGEFVAFVGSSGSGKSTLVRLLLGFEQPESGHVLFDGRSLAMMDVDRVRMQMGVVLQTSLPLGHSILSAIAGEGGATIDEAWEAARLAGLAEEIEAMPMGIHTVLTDGAKTLSGGQRQRLLIARALVHHPRILVFDEATSALDNRTQAEVSSSLEALAITRLAIAHRLSTIERADRVFVLEAGRIVEAGAPRELLARNGRFAQLAQNQLAQTSS